MKNRKMLPEIAGAVLAAGIVVAGIVSRLYAADPPAGYFYCPTKVCDGVEYDWVCEIGQTCVFWCTWDDELEDWVTGTGCEGGSGA